MSCSLVFVSFSCVFCLTNVLQLMLLLGQFPSSKSCSLERLESTLLQVLTHEEEEEAIKLTLLLLLIVQDIPFTLLATTTRLFSILVDFTKASFSMR